MDKLGLRLQMIERRGQLNDAQVTLASASVAKRLLGVLDWSKVHSLHLYESSSAWKEVQTEPFIAFLKQAYPTITIVKGPVLKNSPIPAKKFDVVVVPLLAFDKRCNRLGFGGGWYDKFLAAQPNAVTVGLAYDFQLIPAIPAEPHDVRLTKVVTESQVYG